MVLSIVIVSWNTRDVLEVCLRSVLNSLQDLLDYEITVVDNASVDGSAEMVREKFASVNLIANAENVGYVRANNQAVVVSRGKYILLLNSDTKMIDSGALQVIDYMDNNSNTAIVTGRMLYEDGSFQPPYRRFPGLFGSIARNTFRRIISLNTPFLKRFRYEELDPEEMHDVDWATGAYLYIRRDFLKQDALFDEAIFMYYEDTLLCRRAWNAGYKVTYLPIAPIIHYRGISAKTVRPKTILYSFQSSVVYFERVYGALIARFYRRAVRAIWWLSSLLLGLVPVRRFREKAELFRYLYIEDKNS